MTKFDYSDDDRQYLQMMQENITRMATNSTNCKTWAVTIVAGFLAIGTSVDELNGWLVLALLPVFGFWYLDTFYLHLERGMRNRQKDFLNKVRTLLSLDSNADEQKKNNAISDYNAALYNFTPLMSDSDDNAKGFVSTIDRFFSKSMNPFYGAMSCCVVIIILIVNWQSICNLFITSQ